MCFCFFDSSNNGKRWKRVLPNSTTRSGRQLRRWKPFFADWCHSNAIVVFVGENKGRSCDSGGMLCLRSPLYASISLYLPPFPSMSLEFTSISPLLSGYDGEEAASEDGKRDAKAGYC